MQKDKAPPNDAASWLFNQLGRCAMYHVPMDVQLRLIERRTQHDLGEMYKKLAARQKIVALRNLQGFREAMSVVYDCLTDMAEHQEVA